MCSKKTKNEKWLLRQIRDKDTTSANFQDQVFCLVERGAGGSITVYSLIGVYFHKNNLFLSVYNYPHYVNKLGQLESKDIDIFQFAITY